MHKFYNDSIERIFRLGGEDLLDAEDEGYVEEEDEVNDNLEEKDSTERFEIFSKNHNSIVGHFGIGNTLKAMSLGGKMAGHAKRCDKMDRGMLDFSENQTAIRSNVDRRDRASSLSFRSLGISISGCPGSSPRR